MNFLLVGMWKQFTLLNFLVGGRKNWKMVIFWPPLHKSKLIFHAFGVGMQNFYEFTILNPTKLQ